MECVDREKNDYFMFFFFSIQQKTQFYICEYFVATAPFVMSVKRYLQTDTHTHTQTYACWPQHTTA